MSARDRRLGFRIPLEIFLNQYVDDQPFRGLTTNLSDTGMFVQVATNPLAQALPPPGTPVGLEFELPGTNEIIWARGEICYETDGSLVRGRGVCFRAMPRIHARLVRDFCIETRRSHLASLLERIRRPAAAPAPVI